MKQFVKIVSISALAVLALPAFAAAQQKCPEGRSASGVCVNPGLVASARQTSLVFAQPKISQTAFPILPAEDPKFRLLQQLTRDRPIVGPAAAGTP
jgi:hypothetical protein